MPPKSETSTATGAPPGTHAGSSNGTERSAGPLVASRAGWRNPMFVPRPGIERVAYELRDDQLVRLSWRALDRAPNAEPYRAVLIDDVRDLQWQFLDAAGNWQESWPPQSNTGGTQAATDTLPRAIEVRLDTRLWGELRWLFHTGAEA